MAYNYRYLLGIETFRYEQNTRYSSMSSDSEWDSSSASSGPALDELSEPSDSDVSFGAPRRRLRPRVRRPPPRRSTRRARREPSESSSDDEEYGKPARTRPAPKKKAKRTPSRRQLPLVMVPEDVPWKEPHQQPEADPNTVDCNPTVGFLVIFMSKFQTLFDDIPAIGPQDIEEGIVMSEPSELVQRLFLRLLGLVLNRKKDIELGKYGSALNDLYFLAPELGMGNGFPPINWKSRSAFTELDVDDRLEFLHVLVNWALAASERVREVLRSLSREEATQPWLGFDNDHCRYYLCGGPEQDPSEHSTRDSRFRIYRETNRFLRTVSWRPVASTLEEVGKLAGELEPAGKNSAKLARKLEVLVPELQASEERRRSERLREKKRQELAQQVEQARMGEGRYARRTRGIRVDYTSLVDEPEPLPRRRSARLAARDSDYHPWEPPKPETREERHRRVMEDRTREIQRETEERLARMRAKSEDIEEDSEETSEEDNPSLIVKLQYKPSNNYYQYPRPVSQAVGHSFSVQPPSINALPQTQFGWNGGQMVVPEYSNIVQQSSSHQLEPGLAPMNQQALTFAEQLGHDASIRSQLGISHIEPPQTSSHPTINHLNGSSSLQDPSSFDTTLGSRHGP